MSLFTLSLAVTSVLFGWVGVGVIIAMQEKVAPNLLLGTWIFITLFVSIYGGLAAGGVG